ncbi:MAG: CPBP family intramembrane metalloprotease [Microbacteriaceae bacterium]|nr:CPBP family intramembrane metalloprotease [Microbacteriaceae bacterium]
MPGAAHGSLPRLIPDRRPWAVLGVGLAVLLVAQFAGGATMALVALAESGMPAGGFSFDDGMLGGAPLVAGLLVQAAVALAGYALLVNRAVRRRPSVELVRPGGLRQFGLGVLLGGGAVALAVGVLALAGAYRVTDVALTSSALVGLAIGVGAAVAEEVFFRGIVLHLLAVRFGGWPAMIVVSVLFGLIHATNPGAGWGGALAIVLSAGLLLNAAYLVTGGLWLPIGIHFAWNAAQSAVFGITVSGTIEQRGLLESELVGPVWLTGGAMGIEGSAVLIAIGLAAGLALALPASRRGGLRRERLTATSAEH